ncbi:MAG: divalent-cation tolerance protein CutA [Hadesarchaea archaeon]|nr:divalent-cation tolerance protein CutA [Hadesarchaea archaeon]
MCYLVLVTTPKKPRANEIGQKLVEEELAACANIIEKINSIYRWKGKIEKSNESLLILKTTKSNLDDLINRVKELHSYEVPEVLALPIEKGSNEYLEWLENNVR